MKKSVLIIISILSLIIFIGITYYGCKIYYQDKVIFKLNGDEVINIEYGNEYKELSVSAKIFNKSLTSIDIISNVNTNVLGNYEVKYILKSKLFDDKELIRKVNVIDTVAPVITVEKTEVTLTEGSKFVAPSYSVTDNYDGEITDNIVVTNNVNVNKPGTYKVIYTAKDSSGNESTAEIKVIVKEKEVSMVTTKDDITSKTYIKISISNQKLYYYKNGSLLINTSVVTGKPSTPTPTGIYKVVNKVKNTTLVGDDYISYVSYWIAFIGREYGIHDASWRSNFGGTIYKTDGSHGCINTPTKEVAKLYEYVEVGTPVYIYE